MLHPARSRSRRVAQSSRPCRPVQAHGISTGSGGETARGRGARSNSVARSSTTGHRRCPVVRSMSPAASGWGTRRLQHSPAREPPKRALERHARSSRRSGRVSISRIFRTIGPLTERACAARPTGRIRTANPRQVRGASTSQLACRSVDGACGRAPRDPEVVAPAGWMLESAEMVSVSAPPMSPRRTPGGRALASTVGRSSSLPSGRASGARGESRATSAGPAAPASAPRSSRQACADGVSARLGPPVEQAHSREP
jgi:hypothetical protein